ncbi:restriction endonuclease [Candidatus Persebacteraceae bacterium Df01]|jgi:restriction system protein|uniref:Restriction endonuclease n=1 Tax=Candidatus Doriopsillibacter californiensis TaxID=2970740 RepID=A0ABT7QLS5_9GAMM|nr:restriction endonuclease [Candidatus Persebacteraceae bacterium Df01]
MSVKKSSNQGLSVHLAYTALKILNDNDGKMLLSRLLEEIYKQKSGDIPEAEKSVYEGGRVKWAIKMQFLSDIFVKAGFLRKGGGIWRLTADGRNVLLEGEQAVIEKGKKIYADFLKERQKVKKLDSALADEDKTDSEDESIFDVEQHESNAMESIQKHIRSMLPYRFQDLCAALMRGMNYYVRDIASPGPDGGIDILAYTDQLGGKPPRIKVQVKHESKKSGQPELRQLAGILTDGDIGVFISSAGFASGCRDFARNNLKHLELIDMDIFVDLWQKNYDNLSEEDKSLLPLRSIYFLDKKRVQDE